MSFSIESQAYVVEEHIKELQLSQKLIKHGDSSIRKEKIQKAENTCYLIKTGLETFLLELNTIDDPEELRRWNAWMNQTRTTYENAKNELFSLKNQIDREDLEAENPLSEDSQEKPKLLLQKLANKGDAVQDSTQKAVDNIRFLVNDAEDVGKNVVETMDKQLAQMNQLDNELTSINKETESARSVLTKVARNTASDPCVRILVTLICISIVTTIVLFATKK